MNWMVLYSLEQVTSQKSVVNAGLKLAHMAKLVHGDRYRSRLINKLMFGTYNKRIKDNRTDSDWLTKDTAIVDKYTADPKCSYMFTANGYIGFLNVIRFDINEKNIARTPAALPVLFASGEEDPVGDYGKAVKRCLNFIQNMLITWNSDYMRMTDTNFIVKLTGRKCLRIC